MSTGLTERPATVAAEASAFTTAPLHKTLMLRTALVLEGSAMFCWLLWELYTLATSPLAFRMLPEQHWQSSSIAFFGQSLPWLISAVAATVATISVSF
ncbi:hypothetical protein [Hymenobacter rigui]|uniref:Uncharacterized protein n=1 Tax=Hymenobacter rigui TaxID=334424 RepID=A0A428KXK9_9BACT|nr:hypothetical protein [Hymenobacter rigui]RSK51432.1 hypothetical protein EI291_03740 [Hymenobacter rigui]